GAAISAETLHNVETLHPVETSHVWRVFSFRAMQSFHVICRRTSPENDKTDYSERVCASRRGATLRPARPATTGAQRRPRAGRARAGVTAERTLAFQCRLCQRGAKG